IRTIQIPTPLQKVLDEHYKRCKAMPDFSGDYFICGGVKAIRDTSLSNSCKQCAELAEVKRIRIHDFRHSHASLLANSGINIQEIARRLGHSDVSVTLRIYSHLYPKESERALNVLNNVIE
ncbi:MAG: site-specific integrase, partial [Clostridia bacterium]|nr:site-specific integrase [Clostridia bacterium]